VIIFYSEKSNTIFQKNTMVELFLWKKYDDSIFIFLI
jgi:hypothetical protein